MAVISFSNGKQYTYFISSGMLGFDGEGATVVHKIIRKILLKAKIYDPTLVAETTKTITFHPIDGPKKIKPIRGGWWNDYGLDNPGLNNFIMYYGKKIKWKENLIISIAGKDRDEMRVIVRAITARFPNLLALEYNASCPNCSTTRVGANEVIKRCELIKETSPRTDVIVKVGAKSNNYAIITKGTKGLVKAFRINSVPVEGGGAISGKLAQEVNWRILNELLEASSTPVIAPSIWDYEDMKKVLKMGAAGIDFGSVSMIHHLRPWGPAIPYLWAKKHKGEQDRKDWEMKACARSK